MSKDNVSKDTELILAEIRGVSAAVISLTRHVDRMDERLGNVEHNVNSSKAPGSSDWRAGLRSNPVAQSAIDVLKADDLQAVNLGPRSAESRLRAHRAF